MRGYIGNHESKFNKWNWFCRNGMHWWRAELSPAGFQYVTQRLQLYNAHNHEIPLRKKSGVPTN